MKELKKEFEEKFVKIGMAYNLAIDDDATELFDWIEQKIDKACKKQRDETIEECAKLIEANAEKTNNVIVEERHILQEDTVELFRNDIEFQRLIASKLRELKQLLKGE